MKTFLQCYPSSLCSSSVTTSMWKMEMLPCSHRCFYWLCCCSLDVWGHCDWELRKRVAKNPTWDRRCCPYILFKWEVEMMMISIWRDKQHIMPAKRQIEKKIVAEPPFDCGLPNRTFLSAFDSSSASRDARSSTRTLAAGGKSPDCLLSSRSFLAFFLLLPSLIAMIVVAIGVETLPSVDVFAFLSICLACFFISAASM